MASAKRLCVFAIAWITAVSGFSISYTPHSRGRKLFGGYRIVPKICQPTNPSSLKSNRTAICMFNNECSKRNGDVVGACMDGFLFGACCQLPKGDPQATTGIQANSSPITENILAVHGIDRMPAGGNPIGTSSSDLPGTTKLSIQSTSNYLSSLAGSYTKISTFTPDRSTQRPFVGNSPGGDVMENAEKPQIPPATNVSQLEADITALLGQQEILDDLRLPVLITNSDSNNDIHEHHETSGINPVTTLLSADQILQIADPVDQLPALFSQGLGQNNHSGAETVLLNENGTYLEENNNPDEHFKPRPGSLTSTTDASNHADSQTKTTPGIHGSSQHYDKTSTPTIQQYANMHRLTGSTSEIKYTSAVPGFTQSRTPTKTTNFLQSNSHDKQDYHSKTTILKVDMTTPMSSTNVDNDDLVRVPTITYDAQSGNKKDDELDREEIAINHIISILNATTPTSHTKITQPISHGTSSIHTWTDLGESPKPATTRAPGSTPSTTTEIFPYTFYKPGKPATYYHYDTASTSPFGGSSSFSTSSSSSGSSNHYISRKPPVTPGSYGSSNGYDYSTRPSTNPPAPTVIVLGPLGTEFTTLTTEKPATRRPTPAPIRPITVTKQPSIGTMITHNISTVISTNSASTSNNHVISTSYVSVHLKDSTSPKPIGSVSADTTKVPSSGITNNLVVTKRPSTIWTTLSPWSDKPSFHLKPSKIEYTRPSDNLIHTVVFKETTVAEKPVTTVSMTTTLVPKTTTPITTVSDDETPAPDDLINFPPVRNPNLAQQEKPTIVQTFNGTDSLDIELLTENEIPTPAFTEDEVLTNKVDVFVNKIVQSLQGNFQDLKDVVYNKKNVTVPPPVPSVVTKKPPTRKPAKPTAAKPSSQTTRRPPTKKPARPSGATQKPAGSTPVVRPSKPTTLKPRPTSVISSTTKRPQSVPSKRKPTKKPTTVTTTTTTTTSTPDTSIETLEESADEQPEVPPEVEDTTPDFRTQCGVRPALKSGRIVGGKGATFGEWPWQVLVREATWLGLFTKNKCGGVLITNKYVITAAHCQPGFLATLVAVFGEFDISGELEPKPSITRNVRRIVVHRDYNPATFEADMALLELEKPIVFDAHIVPICMPDEGADFTGRMATVTGWGRVKYNGGTPSVLQEVQVPIMENAVCQEMFKTAGHSKRILDSFLCAGYASGQKDSCEGDSGGPLMIQESDGRWVLVGTVSHGIKCATPYLPGVYMRTTFFKPWLHGATGV